MKYDYVRKVIMKSLNAGDGMYNSVAEKLLNDRTSHLMYRLKPQHRYNEQHPMVNDDIFNRWLKIYFHYISRIDSKIETVPISTRLLHT